MTERERIMDQTGLLPSTCSCSKCESMCKLVPCLGTPSDILKLVNNGYINQLSNTVWAAGIVNGIKPVHMVQLTTVDKGCIMFDESTGYCGLHNNGLKPIEGILANCNMKQHIKLQLIDGKLPAAMAVAKTWNDPNNTRTINLINIALTKHLSENDKNK